MTSRLLIFGLIASVVAVFAISWFAYVYLRGRRLGTHGLVQRSHLRCPKCQQEFDYDWVPGASFTSVRLGKGRYMACPLCHQRSYFYIYDTMVARTMPPDP
ncbi:MAG TPA: hypothetical protein VGU43_01020, partial [Thermoplasmata archaeon]|nr:hypothetical protein [Thermoplasmata archaeon]